MAETHCGGILRQLRQSTSCLLTLGCDDRVEETFHRMGDGSDSKLQSCNRYHSSSVPDDGHRPVNRGSCTISTVTRQALLEADAKRLQVLRDIEECEDSEHRVRDVIDREFTSTKKRIKKLISGGSSGDDDFDIVLAASGTDVEYIPLLIARAQSILLSGGEPRVVNIVCAHGEVGSGTEYACGGKSSSVLRPSDSCSTERRLTNSQTPLNGFGSNEGAVQVVLLQCRDDSGLPVPGEESQRRLLLAVRSALSDEACVAVVHIVLGTKTGLTWPPLVGGGLGAGLEQLTDAERRRVVVAVDACQLRCRLEVCRAMLLRGCVVMLTGSKYYAGPPYSACAAVPAALLREMLAAPEPPVGIVDYLSYADVPGGSFLGAFLERRGGSWVNMGALLRWHVALDTMERHAALDADGILRFVHLWRNRVARMISGCQPFLQVHVADGDGDESIISFEVFCVDDFDRRRRLSHSDLKEFQRLLTAPGSRGSRLFIGQPVALGSTSVLRYALDAESVVSACVDEGGLLSVFEDDAASVARMASLAQRWLCLSRTGYYNEFDSRLCIHQAQQEPLAPIDALSSAMPLLLSQVSGSESGSSAKGVAVLYDMTRFTHTLRLLGNSFSDRMAGCGGSALHCFAVKSAPLSYLLHVLTAIDRRGNASGSSSNRFGLEVASLGELKQALRCGCQADRLVFDSPCKSDEEIRFALDRGVSLNANSMGELTKIEAALARCASEGRASLSSIGLRVNPMVGSGAIAELSTATAASKFGVLLLADGSNRRDVIELFLQHPFLSGIMCHVGSQGVPMEMMALGASVILGLADDVDAAAGRRQICSLDIGGGLSANYLGDDVSPTWQDYCCCLADVCPAIFTCGRDVITEFGKAMVAKAGFVVARVEDVIEHVIEPSSSEVREVDSVTAITHAGADLLLRTCYCPSKFPHRICLFDSTGALVTEGINSRDSIKTSIAGPLCFSGDVILTNAIMPRPCTGDWIAVVDAGANTLSLHSKHCSRAAPAVYCFATGRDGRAVLVKVKDAESVGTVLDFWG